MTINTYNYPPQPDPDAPVTLEMIYERQQTILDQLGNVEERLGEIDGHIAEIAIDSGTGFSTDDFE